MIALPPPASAVPARRIWVPGVPRPKGSKTLVRSKSGHVSQREASPRLAEWMASISWTARVAQLPLLECPVFVTIDFYMPRAANITATHCESVPAKVPDLDKLVRAAFDAVTGIAWRDDALVCGVSAAKHYAKERGPGARIVIAEMLL